MTLASYFSTDLISSVSCYFISDIDDLVLSLSKTNNKFNAERVSKLVELDAREALKDWIGGSKIVFISSLGESRVKKVQFHSH